FEVGAFENAAGRILRRIEDQEPRVGRNVSFEFVRVEREIARLAQIDRHGQRTVGEYLRLVDGETRDRVDDFITGAIVGDRRYRVGDERLGAGAHDNVLGPNVEPAAAPHVGGSRSPELVDAGRRRISVLART